MSDIPNDCKYTQTHEWALLQDDGSVMVGITEHAANLLGDMVFVDLPELESPIKSGQECAVLESVKAAADVYCPISGEVVAINEDLTSTPSLINSDPFGDGWLFRIMPDDEQALEDLLDADSYSEAISEQD